MEEIWWAIASQEQILPPQGTPRTGCCAILAQPIRNSAPYSDRTGFFDPIQEKHQHPYLYKPILVL